MRKLELNEQKSADGIVPERGRPEHSEEEMNRTVIKYKECRKH
jgi:hypothetical protein